MDRPASLPLVGLIEIAMMAGVKRPSVSMWRTRYESFPAPVDIENVAGGELEIGPIFWRPQIEDWLRTTGRRTGAGWSRADIRNPYDHKIAVIKPPPSSTRH